MTTHTHPTPRVRLTGPERREQLLDVVKEIVGEEGFHAVTIEAVARRAGITRPVVYGHFADLGALLSAMLERESARALGQLGATLPTGTGPAALLSAMRTYLETVQADPVTWRLVLMPPEGAPAILRERITFGREAIIAALAERVRPGLAPGRTSPDPELTARMLSAISDESARLLLSDPDRYPLERVMAQAEWLLETLTG